MQRVAKTWLPPRATHTTGPAAASTPTAITSNNNNIMKQACLRAPAGGRQRAPSSAYRLPTGLSISRSPLGNLLLRRDGDKDGTGTTGRIVRLLTGYTGYKGGRAYPLYSMEYSSSSWHLCCDEARQAARMAASLGSRRMPNSFGQYVWAVLSAA